MNVRPLKNLVGLLSAIALSASGFACECGVLGPACSYVSTVPVIFIGTPAFTNEDGSGTFAQRTLYKFTVEEIFKGLPEGTKEVWVDPGSYTSCYAVYELGKRLLVFATTAGSFPTDTAAMTEAKPDGKVKPQPPGFDPKMPVYYAPECTGTREAVSAAGDIAWLRAWKRGETQTRILGTIHDWLDWPLTGAKVKIKSDTGNWSTISDSTGAFLFEPVKPGKYDVDATLAGYRLRWKPQVDVDQSTCGYRDLSLEASGGLSGTVVNREGKPLTGVSLVVARMKGKEETFPPIHHDESRVDGSFLYRGLPVGDYLVGVNLDTAPNVDTPYPKTYAPGVPNRSEARLFHLGPSQTISGIRIQMPPRLRGRTIHLRVIWPNGENVGKGASAETDDEQSNLIDFEGLSEVGTATIKCFAAKPCTIEAKTWLTKPGESEKAQVAASPPHRIEAGNAPVSVTLTLSERREGWNEGSGGDVTPASQSRPGP